MSRGRLGILSVAGAPQPLGAWEQEGLRRVGGLMGATYDLALMDIGAGALHSVGPPLLPFVNQVVLVTGGRREGLRAAGLTLDQLERHGHGELVRGAAVVVNSAPPTDRATIAAMEVALRGRCRAVLGIRRDPRLTAEQQAALEDLGPATRRDYLRLAAFVTAAPEAWGSRRAHRLPAGGRRPRG
jgi:MinD-like ATPase involved in chromosome partitioning or flagellar assembly